MRVIYRGFREDASNSGHPGASSIAHADLARPFDRQLNQHITGGLHLFDAGPFERRTAGEPALHRDHDSQWRGVRNAESGTSAGLGRRIPHRKPCVWRRLAAIAPLAAAAGAQCGGAHGTERADQPRASRVPARYPWAAPAGVVGPAAVRCCGLAIARRRRRHTRSSGPRTGHPSSFAARAQRRQIDCRVSVRENLPREPNPLSRPCRSGGRCPTRSRKLR